MTKLKFISLIICITLNIQGCSKILEEVSLKSDAAKGKTLGLQEEFKINIQTLNLKNAKIANKDKYPRKLMLTGSSTKANVLDEVSLLNANFPKYVKGKEYLIGYDDELTFTKLNKFSINQIKLPISSQNKEYILGIGDILKFIQFNNTVSITKKSIPSGDNLISTESVIGSDGKILFIGIGSIIAANRTLDDVRMEIRNILIRNGNVPNFQLEITEFISKKAYVNKKSIANSVTSSNIPINNIPISLKEICINAGVSKNNKSFGLITLRRGRDEFQITAEQLFMPNTPNVIIQDKDYIEIEILPSDTSQTKTTVGSKGNILLPNIGIVHVYNRSLNEVHKEIYNRLIQSGQTPSFQLDITQSNSQKVYLIEKNKSSKIIFLNNKKISIKELIINSTRPTTSDNGLFLITLKRDGKTFQMTGEKLLSANTPEIWLQKEDQIELEHVAYKPGQVYALSGSNMAEIVPIEPSRRETLADILFVKNGALSNKFAKRSEVYLIRDQNPLTAYHLDTQNVSRILVASNTELRPNDIIFVAERPIISFSRVLSEILPLRLLLRDIKNENIP
jgi:protein involved in polysaccharide export with SLBB domain